MGIDRIAELAELIIDEARRNAAGLEASKVNLFLFDFHDETFRNFSKVDSKTLRNSGPSCFEGSRNYVDLIAQELARDRISPDLLDTALSSPRSELDAADVERLLRAIPQSHLTLIAGRIRELGGRKDDDSIFSLRPCGERFLYSTCQSLTAGKFPPDPPQHVFDRDCRELNQWLSAVTVPSDWKTLHIAPLVRGGQVIGLLYLFHEGNREDEKVEKGLARSAAAAEQWLEQYWRHEFQYSLTEKEVDPENPWPRFIERLPTYMNVMGAALWRDGELKTTWRRRPDPTDAASPMDVRTFVLTEDMNGQHLYLDAEAQTRSEVENFRTWRQIMLESHWKTLVLTADDVEQDYATLCEGLGLKISNVLRMPLALVSPRYADTILDVVLPAPVTESDQQEFPRATLLELFPLLEQADELFAETSWRGSILDFVSHDFRNLLASYEIRISDRASNAPDGTEEHHNDDLLMDHIAKYGEYLAIPRREWCNEASWAQLVEALNGYWKTYVREPHNDLTVRFESWPRTIARIGVPLQLLFFVCIELIRNSAKHGEQGETVISIEESDGWAELMVRSPRPSDEKLRTYESSVSHAAKGTTQGKGGLALLLRLLRLLPLPERQIQHEPATLRSTDDAVSLAVLIGSAKLKRLRETGEETVHAT